MSERKKWTSMTGNEKLIRAMKVALTTTIVLLVVYLWVPRSMASVVGLDEMMQYGSVIQCKDPRERSQLGLDAEAVEALMESIRETKVNFRGFGTGGEFSEENPYYHIDISTEDVYISFRLIHRHIEGDGLSFRILGEDHVRKFLDEYFETGL